ncbi:hypothetical protein CGLO_09734 [Colletotrichum gloeosporioides Cg-14]|uniref:Uncharacterized protein n=1 Tax=Colletotrichum gloeosporioides (strain Cg-14) TaxID=1237896 RepID=T0K5P0_COLGC|nr:hypothetical protein CGLO_09734 [Colletotrichum gloeosporioides Cg-14]
MKDERGGGGGSLETEKGALQRN